jgi:hypothetical protein
MRGQLTALERRVMLALRFSIHIKIKLKGKCPKHPRFNPEIGQGAIRGGCRECLALYQVVAGRDQAATALRQFEEIAERYECSPRPRIG